MERLSTRQWTLLALLTLVRGVNWPIMKAGVTGFPPLTFLLWYLWLGEVLHWQDWSAIALVLVAIASVLWPKRSVA